MAIPAAPSLRRGRNWTEPGLQTVWHIISINVLRNRELKFWSGLPGAELGLPSAGPSTIAAGSERCASRMRLAQRPFFYLINRVPPSVTKRYEMTKRTNKKQIEVCP